MAVTTLYDLPKSVGTSKTPPGAILVTLAALAVTSAVATQVFAQRLAYAPALGRPFAHSTVPYLTSMYVPWAWVRWAMVYASPLAKFEYPVAVHAAVATLPWTLGVGAVVAIFAFVFASIALERPAKTRELVDSARWATVKDLRREGFFRRAGPVIGGFLVKGEIVPLRYDGQNGLEHCGGPGSDKTTQLKTNLLIPLQRDIGERQAMYGDTVNGRRADFWGEEPTIIALDVKALVDSTAGYQKEQLGKDVLIFEPLSEKHKGRASYNSLWNIRIGTDHEPDDCYSATTDLTDADGKGLPTYWDTACTSFGAAAMAVLGYRALAKGDPTILSHPSLVNYISSHTKRVATLPRKVNGITIPGVPAMESIDVLIEDMLRPHDPTFTFGWVDDDGNPTNRRKWIVSAALALQKKDVGEKSGVFGTFMEKLGIFRSEMLRKHISTSSFTFGELANRDRAAMVYLRIPAMQLNHFRPLVRVFVRSAIRELTSTTMTIAGQEVRGNVRSTILALDEVASLRRDDEIATASGYLRGHGVALMLLWQTLQQKLQHYGEHESITATLGSHIFARPEDDGDARKISSALGQFTAEFTKRNRSVKSSSEHTETPTRSLLTSTEVKRLPDDENIVFSRGLTILAKKFPYYKNPILNARAQIPPPAASDVITPRPFFVTNLEKEIGMEKVRNLKAVVFPSAPVNQPEQQELAVERVAIPRTLDPFEAFRLGNEARQ